METGMMGAMKWSEEGEGWRKSRIETGKLPFHVAGLYFDGNRMEVCGAAAQGGTEFAEEAVWNHTAVPYVPPNLLDFQCADGYTNGDVFSGFLSDIVRRLHHTAPDDGWVLAFRLPQREAWKRDAAAYLGFLERVLHKISGNICPTLVMLPQAHAGGNKALYVVVEREWTQFALYEDHRLVGQTAASLGYRTDRPPQQPFSFRLNDYRRDGTEEWSGQSCPSWGDGFAQIFADLGRIWKTGGADCYAVCPEEAWPILKGLLSDGGRRVERIMPARFLATYAEAQLRGAPMQARPAARTADLGRCEDAFAL